jgi:preprotein translocase subunit SecY
MITWMGWICLVLLFFTLVFGFFGFFLTITTVSAKRASHEAIKLSRTALSGKRNSKNVSRDVKSRVTTTY